MVPAHHGSCLRNCLPTALGRRAPSARVWTRCGRTCSVRRCGSLRDKAPSTAKTTYTPTPPPWPPPPAEPPSRSISRARSCARPDATASCSRATRSPCSPSPAPFTCRRPTRSSSTRSSFHTQSSRRMTRTVLSPPARAIPAGGAASLIPVGGGAVPIPAGETSAREPPVPMPTVGTLRRQSLCIRSLKTTMSTASGISPLGRSSGRPS
mmetsp:Transcript_37852/g.120378  ORF Transcript_37852/g.120378 Transcript_37852/m.120378 type:complete len:209 (-) Transcript_37852:278-904(-)